MKQKTKSLLLLSLIPLMMVFSCALFTHDEPVQETTYTLTVNASVSTRSAEPAFPTAYGYCAFAYDSSSNVISFSNSTTTSLTLEFTTIPDSIMLSVYAYDSEATYKAITKATTAPAATAFAVSTMTLSSSAFSSTNSTTAVTLRPVQDGTRTGSISLPIMFPQKPNGVEIKTVTYSLKALSSSTYSESKTYAVSSSDISATDSTAIKTTVSFDSVPSGNYLLTFTFYDVAESNIGTAVFLKQMMSSVAVYYNLTTDTWKSVTVASDNKTLLLTASDFSTHNTSPAAISAKFVDDSNVEKTAISWYDSVSNKIAGTSGATNLTTFTESSTFYGTTVPSANNNAKFTIQLSMPGQSFKVANTIAHYDSSEIQSSTNTATVTGLESSFSLTSAANKTYVGTIPLYAGTNTISITVTASDGTTTSTYLYKVLNPFWYVSATNTPSDTYSVTGNKLTSGAGTSSIPIATVQQAVYDVIGENNVLKTASSTDTTSFTIYITGTLTAVPSSFDASINYYSMVSIVSTANTLDLTIAGTTGNNTSDGIDASTYNKNADANSKPTVRVLFTCGKKTNKYSDDTLSINFNNLFIRGGKISTTYNYNPADGSNSIQSEGGGILQTYTKATFTNTVIGMSQNDYTYKLENSNYATRGGGIALNLYSTATFDKDTLICHNYTDTSTGNSSGGGGISLYSNSDIYLKGTTVSYNYSKRGGGIFSNSGTVNCADDTGNTSIINNKAIYGGGGLYLYESSTGKAVLTGTTEVSSNIVSGSDEAYGGGVYIVNGNLTVNDNATISSNKLETSTSAATKVYGGGVYIGNGSGLLTMTGGTIGGTNSGNTGAYAGGGIYVSLGTATISGGTISCNTLTTGTSGPQIYVKYSAPTYESDGITVKVDSPRFNLSGATTIANADSYTTYDHTIYLETGATVAVCDTLASATDGSYVLKPAAYPSGSNAAVAVLASGKNSSGTAVPLSADVVKKFTVAPESFTYVSAYYTRTWSISSTDNTSLTAGTLYYPCSLGITFYSGIGSISFTETYTPSSQTANINSNNVYSLSVKSGKQITYTYTYTKSVNDATVTEGTPYCYIDTKLLTNSAISDNTKYDGALFNSTTLSLTPPTKPGIYTVTIIHPITDNSIMIPYSTTFNLTVIQ